MATADAAKSTSQMQRNITASKGGALLVAARVWAMLMKANRTGWPAALVLIALITQVCAQPVTLYGVPSCGSWTESRSESWEWAAQRSWLFGFLSGAVTFGKPPSDLLHETDSRGASAWISEYCAAHPLDRLDQAAKELLGELVRRTTKR
jgi:hypothetical protein